MKKKAIWALSCLLLLGVASCEKTTKRKLSNEWNVHSTETIITQISANGDISSSTETRDETSITKTTGFISSDGTTNQSSTYYGVVNSHTMTIDKDGTWKESSDFSYDDHTQVITETTGTWSFVKKNKAEDFKKNERVLFNILFEKITSNNLADPEQDVVETVSHEIGQKVKIFTVTESKNKTLTLEMDKSSAQIDPSYGTSSNTQSIKMVLQQK